MVNVYCPMAKSPNAPYEPGESQQQRQSRWEYKLCFQRLLSMRIRRLLAAGQHVILAGDLQKFRFNGYTGMAGIRQMGTYSEPLTVTESIPGVH